MILKILSGIWIMSLLSWAIREVYINKEDANPLAIIIAVVLFITLTITALLILTNRIPT